MAKPIILSDIPRFSETPIRKIPSYVYGNCNQVTCNTYEPKFLETIKKYSQTITNGSLEKVIPDLDARVKKAEELDWVYGLTQLEEEFLGSDSFCQHPSFNVDQIMRLNGLFSRLCNEAPGKPRQKDLNWANKDIVDYTESLALTDLQGWVHEHLGGNGIDASPKGSEWFASLSLPLAKPQEITVKESWLRKRLKNFAEHPELLSPKKGAFVQQKTNPDLAHTWGELHNEKAADTSRKNKNPGNVKISLNKVFKNYFHFFPPGSKVLSELQTAVDTIENQAMHPIEQASRIWFETVRIHISHEANKRTGKALASAILLANGYLPPIIDKDSTEEYIRIMREGFEKENGVAEFTDFVARKIIETQAKMSLLEIK